MSAFPSILNSPALSRLLSGLKRILKCCPWFLASILIGHLAKENFPFSHWPMYADFATHVDYVFFEDQHGNPIPSRLFNETSARLKRQFNSERKREYGRLRDSDSGSTLKGDFQQQSIENAALLLTRRLSVRLTEKQQADFGTLRMIRVILSYDADNVIARDRYTGPAIPLAGLPHLEESQAPKLTPPPAEDNEDAEESLQ